MGSTMVGSCLA